MSTEQTKEPEITEEQLKEMMEKRTKEWNDFVQTLKDAPEDTVKKSELNKVIDFISEDMEGLTHMIQTIVHNMNILGHNTQMIMEAIKSSQPQQPTVNKTKSGIILP